MSLKIGDPSITTVVPASGDLAPLQRPGNDNPLNFDPSLLGGGLPLQLPIQDGRYYQSYNATYPDISVFTSDFLGTLIAVPFFSSTSKTWTRIGVKCAVGAAGINARLGIYTTSISGAPGSLISDYGEVDLSSIGEKEITISQSLSANTIYWLATCVESSATAKLFISSVSQSVADVFFGIASVGDSAATSMQAAHAYGALPNPFPAATISTASPVYIWLRAGV